MFSQRYGLYLTDHEASSFNRRVAGDYLSDVLVSLSYPREPWFSSSIYIHTHKAMVLGEADPSPAPRGPDWSEDNPLLLHDWKGHVT